MGAIHSDDSKLDETYGYDANGNRERSSVHDSDYITGSNNQLVADGVYTYEYDDEGNMTRQTETATGKVRSFEWDYRNRLVGVTDTDSVGTELLRVAYRYDAMGRRIAKAVDADGAGSADVEMLHFVYDRDDVLLEFEEESTEPSQRYLHGPQVDQVLAQEDAEGKELWLLSDHLGTVKDLANDAGEVTNHRTYDSYGNLIEQNDASFDSRYSFTGREFDDESGLYYYRARYYSGAVGSFITQDPIGFDSGDKNIYRYVANSPLDRTDPLGLYGVTIAQNRRIKYNDNRGTHFTPDISQVRSAANSGKSGLVDIENDMTTAVISFFPIRTGTRTRSRNRSRITEILASDDQGHIVSKELGGSGTSINNLFAQNFRYNQGRSGTRAWRDFEDKTARYLDNNTPQACPYPEFLSYTVWLDYEPGYIRPVGVLGLAAFTDGKTFVTDGGVVPNPK